MLRLKLGIVGCGEVAQILHLPSLAQLKDRFRVVALCDVSPQVLGGLTARWQVEGRHTDYRDLVARRDIDAVLVANPDAFHAETALAAIAAGKHVLIEKPMCLTLREADEIASAADRAGVVVQVGYMRRYAPALAQAVAMLPDLGPIRLARVHAVVGENALFIGETSTVIRATDLEPEQIARGKEARQALVAEALGKAAGDLGSVYGLLLGLNSHDISAMRELLGRPRSVLYAAERPGPCITAAFDYGDFVCQFETALDGIPRFDAHIEVYGRDRVLRVQYDTPYVRNLPIRLSVTEANGRGGVIERAEHPAWGDAFVEEWRAFHSSVVEGRKPKTTPEDYREDLELFLEMIGHMAGP